MKSFISTILFCLFIVCPAVAQDVEMADVMRSNGKIYVVVAVIAIIFIGLMVYLYRIDQRVNKLEE
jgi:CcmD family protein